MLSSVSLAFSTVCSHYFGKKPLPGYVQISDSTLRDGEQQPGLAMLPQEKLTMALALAKTRVDALEIGFPASSEEQQEAVRLITKHLPKSTTIIVFSRTKKEDIDTALACAKNANDLILEVVGKCSDSHLERLFQKQSTLQERRNANLALIKETIAYGAEQMKQQGRSNPEVSFVPEDAIRCDRDYLCKVYEVAIEGGATRLIVPDTVGIATPKEYGELIRYLIDNVKGGKDVVWTTHTHNDLGLATANAIAGIEAGARDVQTSLAGIGERTGNAATEQIAMLLTLKKNVLGSVKGNPALNLKAFLPASQLLSQLTKHPIPMNLPIVGANTHTSASGMHQAYSHTNPDTYHPYPAEWVGKLYKNFLGALSGKKLVKTRLKSLSIVLPEELWESFMKQFKTLAYKIKREVSLEELRSLAMKTNETSLAVNAPPVATKVA
jgi:2-isopropylmalate synthase